jgi:PLAT/LH2 domain
LHLKHRKIENSKKPRFLSFLIGFIPAFVAPISMLVLPSKMLGASQDRPVYIVAHRCNTGSQATNAVKNQGVNAIEADFMYGRPDIGAAKDWYLAHDNVLPTSVRLKDWLKDVSQEASRVASPLTLLHVDIKTPDAPLEDLFDQIKTELPTVNLIFDIGLVKNGTYLARIKDRILNYDRAVAAMGFDDSPTAVNDFFKKEGYPLNKYWYEIGLAAAFGWSAEEQNWARDAIKSRDAGLGPKVVIWTFEKESTVKEWLDAGVDAILVNSSECFGRTTAFATDADTHVKNAKTLANAKYGKRTDNAFPTASVSTKKDPVPNNPSPPVPSNPVYQVSIKTGDKVGAGTDSNIFMTIYGDRGQTGEIRLNGLLSGNAFERNQIDALALQGFLDVGTLTKVKIRSDGNYAGAAWYLERVTINGKTARFGQWLEKNQLSAEASF